MKCKFFLLFILSSFARIFAQENYEPGVILLQVRQPEVVRFNNGQVINGSSQLQAVFQQYPAIRSRKLSHVNAETDGCYRIEFPLGFPLVSIQSALTACPDIKIVTLNHYGILAGIPNDPLWTDQWALQKIQMPKAWDVTKPNSTILIGIMDTGLDYIHVDLVDNIWTNPNEIAGNGVDDDGNGYIDDIRGWDFVDGDNNPQEGALTHGTRVAGVIAARTYNGVGLAGIAGGWQSQVGVRLIGLRIVRDASGGGVWFEQEAKEAIDYLTWLRQQYGYTIIANMSIQTTGVTDEPMPFFQASVNAARNAGVIMVAAAGNVVNDPKSPYKQPAVILLPIPARYLGVLAIGASQDGATLQNELRSSYSLYDGDGRLLVVAPVDKTLSLNVVTTIPGNQYFYTFNGTSAACPMTVGVVALMLTLNTSLTYDQIAGILEATAEKIGGYTYDSYGHTDEVGHGRLNAYQALLLTHAYSNKSMSAAATAANNGRRLVKTSDGKYHLVFESGITSGGNVLSEIFYRNSTDGVNWSTPVRLSAGNEQNRYPSIAERSGKLYVVWQRKTGTNTYDIHFRHFNGSSWETLRNVTTGISGDPLPVIATSTPSVSFEMMVAYRTGSGLKSKRSTSTTGSTWETEKTITTNTSGRNPSLVYKQGTGFLVTWDNFNTVYYQAYNGSSWGSATNVSGPAGSSSSYSTESSIALAGNLDRHIAWKAEDPQLGDYVEVVFHNKNLNPSVFTEFADLYGNQYIRPSITGHNGAVASLVWEKKSGYTPIDVRKARYNGSNWDTNPEGTVVASAGFYPSISVQNPPVAPRMRFG
ncbi:MAG: S8 family serine peptidase [candidate division KSB1 bacterium]|nr:S8 family serine peptidase [candidate division KSB1 bacterium]